jgi:hypothetical protein
MTCAIEDAGFEIRDSIHWIYGSGFPKSLDVSKAIDAAAGAERTVIGKHPNPGSTNARRAMGDGWQASPDLTAPATEAARQWSGWGTALKPAHEPCVVARKPLDGTVAANVLAHGTGGLNVDGCRIPHASAEDLAKHAAGVAAIKARGGSMGNSWKNSSDLAGANEVSAQGRWPANIVFDEDAALELDEQSNGASRFFYCAKASKSERFGILKCDCEALHSQPWDFEDRKQNEQTDTTSLAMDTCAVTSTDECALLTLSSGNESTDQSRQDVKFTTSTEIRQTTGSKTCNPSTLLPTSVCMADASCATACGSSHADCVASSSQSALNAGTYRPKGGRSTGDVVHVTSLKSSPKSVCGKCGAQLRLEAHPTQKPTSLMRWLVRLVTPPNGLVLDPFAGSGSTGVAAMREGLRFVGLELSEEYAAIARARIANAVEVQDAQLDLA